MDYRKILDGLRAELEANEAIVLEDYYLNRGLTPKAAPEPVEEPADRMAELTALLLEIERDYPEILPEIKAFTEAMVRGDRQYAYRALLQTGAAMAKFPAEALS